MNEKYSRRALLKALGAGAALLPLLDGEVASAADAGAGVTKSGAPKRFISITWTNGIYGSNQWPSSSASLAASTLPAVLAPLAPYASKMILPRGVNLQAVYDATSAIGSSPYGKFGGHGGYPCILTGTQGGTSPSIDSLIAANLSSKGVVNPRLNVGCLPEGTYTSWSTSTSASNRVFNSQVTDPYRLFAQLFPGSTASASQLGDIARRRKSVLDTVLAQLNAFQGVVGTDDKAKIQTHLDSVRQLEMDLQAAQVTCTPPTLTPQGVDWGAQPVNTFKTQVNFMMRLAAAAITCGVSRCVTMDLINDGGGDILTFPWLNINSPNYHAIAHAGSADATQKTAIDSWWYTQVATLLSALDASPEGAGTTLDNSVVLLGTDMQEGNNHYTGSIPFVMVGSCGGFFKTGQRVGLGNVPNNKLLTSICHAMDLEVASVGNSNYPGDLDAQLT